MNAAIGIHRGLRIQIHDAVITPHSFREISVITRAGINPFTFPSFAPNFIFCAFLQSHINARGNLSSQRVLRRLWNPYVSSPNATLSETTWSFLRLLKIAIWLVASFHSSVFPYCMPQRGPCLTQTSSNLPGIFVPCWTTPRHTSPYLRPYLTLAG